MFKCPYCGSEPKIIPGERLFPYDQQRSRLLYWRCPFCQARVACHPGTTIPMGKLANKELAEARRELHMLVDSIWMNGYMTRIGVYTWLARELKIKRDTCHVSNFTEKQIKEAGKICLDFLNRK